MTAASRWQWLDFDERESNHVRDFLSLQAIGEGVDALRIGASVRDRMADRLFPGTSTQYTRLRYVFLCPAILGKRGASRGSLASSQQSLNRLLTKANPGEKGIIGKRESTRDFVHLYWTAVRTWRLVEPVTDARDVTVDNGLLAMQSCVDSDEEGNALSQHRVTWDPAVLELVGQFWADREEPGWPSIYCRRTERDFVLRRWMELPGDPALAAFASEVKAGRAVSGPSYPWAVPVTGFKQARAELERARAISLICWGVQLAYNFALLASAQKLDSGAGDTTWKRRGESLGDTRTKIDKLFSAWKFAVEKERASLDPWRAPAHWDPFGNVETRAFLARAANDLAQGDIDLARKRWSDVVEQRERNVNPAPKLCNATNLATWSGTPEMARRWDFRWGASVQQFLKDAENPRG